MIFLGADHAGWQLKEAIKKFLEEKSIEYKDLSLKLEKNDDYPDHAKKVVKSMKKDDKGILICGSGTGMMIAANRSKKIRAAFVYDEYSAIKSREDNDANIITLRGKNFPVKKAVKLVDLWLKTRFSEEKRHKRRIKKL